MFGYTDIINPYNTTATRDALKTETETRNKGDKMTPAIIYMVQYDTYANLETLANSRNGALEVVLTPGISGPTSVYDYVAAAASNIAFYLEQDPARPIQYVAIKGVLAPPENQKFKVTERNNLLQKGIATIDYNTSNQAQFERIVTTYKTNSAGAVDKSYKDLEDVANLIYLRYTMTNYLKQRYPRFKIANDTDTIRPGSNITQPSLIKAALVSFSK